MFALRLRCTREDVDEISFVFWEAGTGGVRETELDEGQVELIAGFERNDAREALLEKLVLWKPEWYHEPEVDWVRATQDAWRAREIGQRFFLAPPWEASPTPSNRVRVVHNPGLACGTGEHPCTQLALCALERVMLADTVVADVGTGSGILAIAALRLGARTALGLDIDEAALSAARQNFALNRLDAKLAVGSADCVESGSVDVLVANINASVLLSLADELIRVVRGKGRLILTGFSRDEAATVSRLFSNAETLELDGWSCLIATPS